VPDPAAVASAWIAASPNLLEVLDWHRGLCGACQPGRHCAEYGEIIAEYGAGPFGTAVFWPDGERM
jgi:hypothetical protein